MLNVIPEPVVCDILSEWCALFEIVKFDSAVSANKQRGHLQQLYSKKIFSVKIRLTSNKFHSLAWCSLKGVSVSEIEVTSQNQIENIPTVYSAYSTSIKYITCDPTYFSAPAGQIHPLINFINECDELNGITFRGSIYAPHLMNINADVLAKLTTFDAKSFGLSHSFIEYMAQHCRQLTSLTSRGFNAENELVLIEIIEKNEVLRDIHIEARGFNLSAAILDTLTTRLHCLSYVYLTNCSKIPFRSLVKFILVASKKLKSLELTTGFYFSRQGFNYSLGVEMGVVISSLHINLEEANNNINSSTDLLYIFEQLTTLDHIGLVDVGDILTYEVLTFIAKNNSKLSRLKVVRDSKYKVAVLQDMFKDCTQAIEFSNY